MYFYLFFIHLSSILIKVGNFYLYFIYCIEHHVFLISFYFQGEYNAGYFNGDVNNSTQENVSSPGVHEGMYTPPPGVHEDMYNRGFLEGVVHAVPITVLSELHPQVIELYYFSSFVQFKLKKNPFKPKNVFFGDKIKRFLYSGQI